MVVHAFGGSSVAGCGIEHSLDGADVLDASRIFFLTRCPQLVLFLFSQKSVGCGVYSGTCFVRFLAATSFAETFVFPAWAVGLRIRLGIRGRTEGAAAHHSR